MKHVMALTGRHAFPSNEGEIFPSNNEEIMRSFDDGFAQEQFFARMLDTVIPKDTTELVVYCSGLQMFHKLIAQYCARKCIKLIALFWNRKGNECDPRSYERVSLKKYIY